MTKNAISKLIMEREMSLQVNKNTALTVRGQYEYAYRLARTNRQNLQYVRNFMNDYKKIPFGKRDKKMTVMFKAMMSFLWTTQPDYTMLNVNQRRDCMKKNFRISFGLPSVRNALKHQALISKGIDFDKIKV